MVTITLNNAGVHSFGKYTKSFLSISETVDNNVTDIKTLINGQWKSWTKGSPEAFQGVTEIQGGRGYIARTTATSILEFPDTGIIDLFEIPAILGDNLIAVPSNLPAGDTERYTVSSMKTLENNQWKSWTKGSPDIFQGFLNLNRERGYYANITEVKEDTSYDLFTGEEGVLPYAVSLGIVTEFMFEPTQLNEIDEGLRYALYGRKINL